MVRVNAGGTTLKQGGGILPSGKYHICCETVDVKEGDQEWNRGQQQVVVKLQAYAPEADKGKSCVDFLPLEGETRDGAPQASRFFQFCRAMGIISEAEHAAWSNEGVDVDVDETLLVGAQCLMEREVTKTGKAYHKYFHLDDPKAKDFPKSKELLDMLEPDGGGQAGGGSAPGDSAPAPSGNGGNGNGGGQPAQPAGAGAPAGGFNDPDL